MSNLAFPRIRFIFVFISPWFAISLATAQTDIWWQFRGAGGINISQSTVPIELSDAHNNPWKIDLPGKGASSPIVVGNQVIVTSSAGMNQEELFVQSIDVETGTTLWCRKFAATGSSICHELTANAAPTPVSDGSRIYAFFSSNDLICLDLAGNLIWYRGLGLDYPQAANDYGMASSPVVHDGVVVVQVENPGDSFAIGIDASNGTTRWTTPRKKQGMWSSPLLLPIDESRAFILLQGKSAIDILDTKTGEITFTQPGECSSISSAAVIGNQVYVPLDGTTAFEWTPEGQLRQLWNSPSLRPNSASSILLDEKIYALNSAGALMSFAQSDGSPLTKIRVAEPRSVWATPIIAGGHAFVFTQFGKLHVVRLTGDLEVVHEFDFGTEQCFLGSPAIADSAMYVRSHQHLWKFAGPSPNAGD